jgi:hypothetical protein
MLSLRSAAAVTLAALAASCSDGEAASAYKSALIDKVPHVRQKPDFCGEACAEMYLRKLGSKIDQDEVFDLSGLAPAHGRGCYAAELKRALDRIGFKTGTTWYPVEVARARVEMETAWKALHADLVKSVPSLVCMHYADGAKSTEHFRLVLGYDARKNEVIYHEPAEKDAAYRRMKLEMFLKLWPLKYNSRRWTLVRMRLEPGKLVKSREVKGLTDADYAQHVLALKKKIKKKLPGAKFAIVVQKPFVVIGDESPRTVKHRALRTVKWATDKLKGEYFPKDPEEIYDIWLFKDRKSYTANAKTLFGYTPTTPYGYCSSSEKALVMNIATGGGTLVHEMVHAFMHPNFPACPAWFNEGMGSLYEQCGSRDGKIWGYTNWRLPGLQKAIRAGKVPSFKELCSTTTHQFYNRDKGTNYAQARYLCYYLQQHDLLHKYYHKFHRDRKTDPSGYKTLMTVLGKKTEKEMEKFKKDWEAWVLKLRFR